MNLSVYSPFGSFLITRTMNNKKALTIIPIMPQERPNTGSTLRSLFPIKSSQLNTVDDAQKLPPSLIFDDIQNVCAETAKPKNVMSCKPAVILPLSVDIISKRPERLSPIDFPNGATKINPNNVGIRYAATSRLSITSGTFPRSYSLDCLRQVFTGII